MAKPTAVIADGAANTVPVRTRDELVNELAAVAIALLDKREERTKVNKKFTADIKELEKRQREVATTINAAPGIRDSLQMTFGSVVPAAPPEDEDEGNGN